MSTLRGHYPLKSTGAGFSIENIEIDPPIVKLSGTKGTTILNDLPITNILTEEIENGVYHKIMYFTTDFNSTYYRLDLEKQPMELELWTNDPGR